MATRDQLAVYAGRHAWAMRPVEGETVDDLVARSVLVRSEPAP